VLGTSPFSIDGGTNEYYAARIQGAADLYFAEKVDTLLVSGDNRTNRYNEPAKMQKSLMAIGVPPEAIVLDYAGRDTLDSVLRAREIFGVVDPIIVTQRFHADRALYMSSWNGMDSVAYIVPDGTRRLVRLKLAVRELFARSKMLFELVFSREMHISGPRVPII
jgi:SanA protein